MHSTTLTAADRREWQFHTMASIDNPKASKATAYGYLNAILYMAPAESAGVGNLCPHAGACKALCLGLESGQAAIRREGEDNPVTLARKARARMFMQRRTTFWQYVVKDIRRLRRMASRARLKLCYRVNGSSDIGVPIWLLEMFPRVTFIDYTKNPNKMAQYLAGRFPANYFVTFSRDTHNERLAERFIGQGGNVAIVGNVDAIASDILRLAPRVDGDKHDIRTPELDGRGVVVALTPKGHKAKTDTSGFVVR